MRLERTRCKDEGKEKNKSATQPRWLTMSMNRRKWGKGDGYRL
jgi:hypothetical protein